MQVRCRGCTWCLGCYGLQWPLHIPRTPVAHSTLEGNSALRAWFRTGCRPLPNFCMRLIPPSSNCSILRALIEGLLWAWLVLGSEGHHKWLPFRNLLTPERKCLFIFVFIAPGPAPGTRDAHTCLRMKERSSTSSTLAVLGHSLYPPFTCN